MTSNVSPSTYQAVVIRAGLRAWRDHKMQVNRAYTPGAMMKAAARITGERFKARDYTAAIEALDRWIANRPPIARD